MDFSEALVALKQGKKVKRKIWRGNTHVEMCLRRLSEEGLLPSLTFYVSEGNEMMEFLNWSPSQSDLFKEDWIVFRDNEEDKCKNCRYCNKTQKGSSSVDDVFRDLFKSLGLV